MKIFKIFLKILFIFCCGFIIINSALSIYCCLTPKFDIKNIQTYTLLDNNNNVISDSNNKWITLDNISNYLITATISTEDKNFYKHWGFDYFRMFKAIIVNISNKELSEGASTITQQYARNLFLNYEKTWSRKIDEAILAYELETHYTKDEILEGYLNTINYGGVFGIENAAKYYFNKSASQLNLAEASMLAGIPQSPSNYSPFNNENLAKERQNIVLNLMVKNKNITSEEKIEAYNENLHYENGIKDKKLTFINYFKDSVIEELGEVSNIPDSILETGEVKIYTTLDTEAQEILENSCENNPADTQIAAVMINPHNGEIMALIGGNDYSLSQYNRVTKAKRQVGSTIKPILYYAALEKGFTSNSSFISELTTFNLSNNQKYTPKNYNNTYANDAISMGAAIAYSDNVYAVKTHLFLGENTLINYAKKLGITSNLSAIPSLALGTEEISLLEMVNSYASFANLGYKVNSHFIRKIEDKEGNILYEYNQEKEKIFNESIVYILNEMLTYTYDSDFIDYNYPTVISLLPKITNKYAIKTGTTNTDNWIIGYNNNVVLGVWNGYDNNEIIDSNSITNHKNVWIDTMENLFSIRNSSWYNTPSDVVGVNVNPINGKIVSNNNEKTKLFYFIKGTEPSEAKNNDNLEETFKENYNYIKN